MDIFRILSGLVCIVLYLSLKLLCHRMVYSLMIQLAGCIMRNSLLLFWLFYFVPFPSNAASPHRTLNTLNEFNWTVERK